MSPARKQTSVMPRFPGDDEPDWYPEYPSPDDDPDSDDVMAKPRNPALKPRKRPRPSSKKCRVGRKKL